MNVHTYMNVQGIMHAHVHMCTCMWMYVCTLILSKFSKLSIIVLNFVIFWHCCLLVILIWSRFVSIDPFVLVLWLVTCWLISSNFNTDYWFQTETKTQKLKSQISPPAILPLEFHFFSIREILTLKVYLHTCCNCGKAFNLIWKFGTQKWGLWWGKDLSEISQ